MEGSGGAAARRAEPSHRQQSRHGTVCGMQKVSVRCGFVAAFLVLDVAYKSSRASHVSTATLWNSLRSGQGAFAGLLLLRDVSWQLPWANFVVCDESEAGLAVRPPASSRRKVSGQTLLASIWKSKGKE